MGPLPKHELNRELRRVQAPAPNKMATARAASPAAMLSGDRQPQPCKQREEAEEAAGLAVLRRRAHAEHANRGSACHAAQAEHARGQCSLL